MTKTTKTMMKTKNEPSKTLVVYVAILRGVNVGGKNWRCQDEIDSLRPELLTSL